MKNLRLVAALVFMLFGYAEAATVSFLPNQTSVNIGEQFSVDIIGSEFADLSGGVIDLGMDGMLQVQSVEIHPYWDDLTSTTGYAQSSEVWSGIEFRTLFNPPANGDFTIATIMFLAISPGSSDLSVLDSSEFFGLLDSINPNAIASTVTISAVPLPAAVWLFAGGLLGMLRLSAASGKKTSPVPA